MSCIAHHAAETAPRKFRKAWGVWSRHEVRAAALPAGRHATVATEGLAFTSIKVAHLDAEAGDL